MGDRYDIFISYRRDGGDALACLISEKLKQLGYNVFYDVESLRSGLFNTKLLSVIENCKDIILVLPPNALDRCNNDDDWVRKEIEHAISCQKNIIPVMIRGFQWPSIEELPEKLQILPNYNGISANMEYFDATYTKLLSMLESATLKTYLGKEYYLIYNSFSRYLDTKLIISKIKFDKAGRMTYYSNIKNYDETTCDYCYHGVATETEQNIYVSMNNDDSRERVFIALFKGAGTFNRYIGIMNAQSSSCLPVSFKCVCVPHECVDKINKKLLDIVLSHKNQEWNDNLLALESYQIGLFYSEDFLVDDN